MGGPFANFMGRRGVLAAAGLALAGPAPRREEAALFFYPAPYRIDTGAIMYSPFAIDPGSCTNLFPRIADMSGLVVMPFWSQVEPRRGVYDFSLIDKCLDFWGGLGKRVVLGVITVGYPVRITGAALSGATPDWLLNKVLCYRQKTSFIGTVKPIEPAGIEYRFPVYWDHRFVSAQIDLAAQLSRYDGHPAIAKIRIPTGITGEDNPAFDGLRSAVPGFSNIRWIDHCHRMVSICRSAFRRSSLEFDIDRIGWIKAAGSAAEQQAADGFMHELREQSIYLAMDGLDTANATDWLSHRETGTTKSIDFLCQFRQEGKSVGFEGGSLDRLAASDLAIQARVFRKVGASRLVLFSDSAAALNFARLGANKANATARALFGDEKLLRVAKLAERFFLEIGLMGGQP